MGKIARCPYCVAGGQFHPMGVREDRLTCELCGHEVVANDKDFRCGCTRCLKIHSSLQARNAQLRTTKEINPGRQPA